MIDKGNLPANRRFVSIGVVARRLNVSPTTLRELESRAVVTPARLEGQDVRIYSLEDIETIRQYLAANPLRRVGAYGPRLRGENQEGDE